MLHTFTIGISAFLLYSVQPMISKIILPAFGSGSSIWLTSLIFFQALLLAGYAAIHLVVRFWNPAWQFVFHAVILLAALFFIPLQVRMTQAALPPTLHIFVLLKRNIRY